jgi:hypothetical protein
MAKSEIRAIHVWWTVENLVFQHTGGHENDFAINIIFGEHQVMAQLIAKSVRIAPLITKDFPVRHPLLARGNVAAVNLNHQK